MSGMKLADPLSLFDHKYTGETGQAYSGGYKRDSLKSQSHITEMELASKVLHTILVNTAQVLAIRYPTSEVQHSGGAADVGEPGTREFDFGQGGPESRAASAHRADA
jgi:hypothetical protein